MDAKKGSIICFVCWTVALILNIISAAVSSSPSILHYILIGTSGVCTGAYLTNIFTD